MMTSKVETCRFIGHLKLGCLDYLLHNHLNECADFDQGISEFAMHNIQNISVIKLVTTLMRVIPVVLGQ